MKKKEVIRIGRTTDVRLSPYDKASQEFNDTFQEALDFKLQLEIEKLCEEVKEAARVQRLAKNRLAKKLAKATIKINKK